MDASLLLSCGNTLNSVNAALVLELGINTLALDDGDDFLQPAGRRLRRREHLNFPMLGFRIARVHTEDFRGEERRFVSPVPARISRMIFFSSFGSLGRSNTFSSSSMAPTRGSSLLSSS